MGSRSSEATLVYHLLLSSVTTVSTLERQVTGNKSTDGRRKLQIENDFARCAIVTE